MTYTCEMYIYSTVQKVLFFSALEVVNWLGWELFNPFRMCIIDKFVCVYIYNKQIIEYLSVFKMNERSL